MPYAPKRESDTSNPDVGRVFLKQMDGVQRFSGAALDLDKVEGWVKLVDAAEEYKDHVLVVNSAARNSDGIEKNAKLLEQSLSGYERKLTIFWVINTQRDSLELFAPVRENEKESNQLKLFV